MSGQERTWQVRFKEGYHMVFDLSNSGSGFRFQVLGFSIEYKLKRKTETCNL